MSNEPKEITSYNACSAPSANNTLIGMGNGVANMMGFTVKSLLGNSSCNVVIGNTSWLLIKNLPLEPANSEVGGYPSSSIFFTNSALYCVLANGYIMKAASLSPFP